jgi:hypothetical protein
MTKLGPAKCKKCGAEYEAVGVDDLKIDPDGQFNLHAVQKRCVNCGSISNLVYHGETLPIQSQNKNSNLDAHLREQTESFERNLRDIAEMGRWRKYKY